MLLVGLTGGIASGKSTVSNMFKNKGAAIIDADLLSREILEPGQPAFLDLVDAFGPGILDSDQRIDRKVLGRRVFADPEVRKTLESITHPRIFELFQTRTQQAEARGERVVLYDAPLLYERGLDSLMNAVIVVSIPLDMQKQRLTARDGLDEAAVEQRLAAQWPLSEKVEKADYVIDNAHTLSHTEAQVDHVWRQLAARGFRSGHDQAKGRAQ